MTINPVVAMQHVCYYCGHRLDMHESVAHDEGVTARCKRCERVCLTFGLETGFGSKPQ